MKPVIWQDATGRLRRSFLRDTDPDELAEWGLPADAPNLAALDWHSIALTIEHKLDAKLNGFDWQAFAVTIANHLVNRSLFSWQDVNANQGGISPCILAALQDVDELAPHASEVLPLLRRPIVGLFRQAEKEIG